MRARDVIRDCPSRSLARVTSGSTSAAMADPLDLRYPGGKGVQGLAAWICSHLPPHVFYAEPFAGKGGVFREKLPALRTWLIDRDREVLRWWGSQQLRSTIVLRGDGIRWVELAAEWGPPELLVYCDPPYLPETRTKRRVYRHEMTAADHGRLLNALAACRCLVAVSGYASAMYDANLAGWRRESRWVMTRGGVLREEILWLNSPAATSGVAREYSALGQNFRERERVNRKAERWASRILAMPAAERRAVLLRVLDAAGGRDRRR